MSKQIAFEDEMWDVIKDCGTFYVAQIGDRVRNIHKAEVTENGQDRNKTN